MHCAALDKLSFVSTTKYVLHQVFSWKCTFDFPSTVVIVSQELVRRIVRYSLTILQPLCSSIIIDLIDTPQGPLLNIRICLKIARILNINAVELKLFRWKTQSAYTNHTPEPFYLETRTKPGEQHTAADEASLSQSVSLTAKAFCSSQKESYSDWKTWPCTFSIWCVCAVAACGFHYGANVSIMHSLPQTHTLLYHHRSSAHVCSV